MEAFKSVKKRMEAFKSVWKRMKAFKSVLTHPDYIFTKTTVSIYHILEFRLKLKLKDSLER